MIFTTIFMIMPVLSFGQDAIIIGKNPKTEKKISYSFINEYGFQVASGQIFTKKLILQK